MCANCDWSGSVDQIDEILERAEELPEVAQEFQEGVVDRLKGIQNWMIENKHITPKMEQAIENIELGIEKWFN